ncbi:saccharopine dehydrogenase family protein [Roseofilum casamattae]|uniref:Saccharopine dehydrogenase NADP-binding domain-containing protein n=1 Tax=Roseofilum casamattae BLCC-M143 TaxID=3022442 RepID=A0ABT7BUL9_9CYAN|nr:saccharopine dehydrogenase NADP-binding domain-containing protein [Roseofilum casamattae]MDJ1182882.1 saccharopine dehydrogenase NADP-binding domain-containing protein [Roseofilum casamattae BLCC-M143]
MASDRILILGGTGRIGRHIALDLRGRIPAKIMLAGRQTPANEKDLPGEFLPLDLEDMQGLRKAIANSRLVIHCAGPFHYRDARVLQICIDSGVNYLDISDCRTFTQKALNYAETARSAGVTAIINTGVFPGISNGMVRQGADKLDIINTIKLYYGVGGSGGAGLTVMRTTFLGLQHPFPAWIDGKWQTIAPYSDRQLLNKFTDIPAPFDRIGVYWYDVPETFTFAESFPVQTVVTKFGSAPDFYNYLTGTIARYCPTKWLQNSWAIETLSQISYRMTQISDRFSGIGIFMLAELEGEVNGKPSIYRSQFYHENTAIAAGCGTGSIAEWIWTGKLEKPGVWPVERAITGEQFTEMMRSRSHLSRNLTIKQSWH